MSETQEKAPEQKPSAPIPKRNPPRNDGIKSGTLDVHGFPIYDDEKQKHGSAVLNFASYAKDLALTSALMAGQAGGNTSPMSMVIQEANTAMIIGDHISRGFKEGYERGSIEKERHKSRQTVLKRKNFLKSPDKNASQLVSDLVQLSQDPRTTYDVNRRLTPTAVAERAVKMIAKGGRNIELELPKLGIRSSPNLIDALENYHAGGREQLVDGGLVDSETIKAKTQRMEQENGKSAASKENETKTKTTGKTLMPVRRTHSGPEIG